MLGKSEFWKELAQCRSAGCEMCLLGKTELGRDIIAMHKGNFSGGQTLIQGGIHAREWVTAMLVMSMLRDYRGDGGVWAIPFVNVDGAMLCQFGLDSVSYNSVGEFNVASEITAFGALNKNRKLTSADEILNQNIRNNNLDLQTANEKNNTKTKNNNLDLQTASEKDSKNTRNSNLDLNVANEKNASNNNLDLQTASEKDYRDIDFDSVAKFLVETNGGSENFADWKANARAVDLNVNFDAKWGSGESNWFFPSPSNYVGQFACSESETRALVDITNSISPAVTLSYHARGEVIYHGFDGVFPFAQVAEKIASSTGYALENSRGSAGGYKDWFVATRRKLGLTIEVGKDATPCDELEDYLYYMRQQNAEVLDIATQLATNC